MVETWDPRQLIADGFQHVYVELDWWDGPRAGLVDIDGVPHYYERAESEDREELDPGTDPRYDELTALLTPHRRVPPGARRLLAEWRFDDGERYRLDGTDNWVRWSPAD